jgi:hypothetical protein
LRTASALLKALFVMPRCVHCNADVAHLMKTENGTCLMCGCLRCGAQSVDPYTECTTSQLFIDAVLLHSAAWTHLLYNRTDRTSFFRLALVVLVTALLEVYVAEALVSYSVFLLQAGTTSLTVPSSNAATGSAAAARSAAGQTALSVLLRDAVTSLDGADELYADHGADALLRPTLQLIPNLHSPRVSLIRFDRMPTLLAYGLLEFLFMLVGAAWCGSWLVATSKIPQSKAELPDEAGAVRRPLQPNGGKERTDSADRRGGMADWASAMALAAAAKLLYAAFLVWDIPVYLTAAVDVTYFLWVLQGMQTVAPEARVRSCVVVVVVTALLRCFFRRVTRWCPFFVSTEAFPLATVT